MSDERGLPSLDHQALAKAMAARCAGFLARGADHLLTAGTLRTILMTVLLGQGAQPHEMKLDHRIAKGRSQVWLALDSGVCTTLTVSHPRHGTSSRQALRPVAAALVTSAEIPAHEHLAVALVPVDVDEPTSWAGWPLSVGAEVEHPPGALVVSCTGLADAGTRHRLVVWQAHRMLPDPRPVTRHPHLFVLPRPAD